MLKTAGCSQEPTRTPGSPDSTPKANLPLSLLHTGRCHLKGEFRGCNRELRNYSSDGKHNPKQKTLEKQRGRGPAQPWPEATSHSGVVAAETRAASQGRAAGRPLPVPGETHSLPSKPGLSNHRLQGREVSRTATAQSELPSSSGEGCNLATATHYS